MRFRAPKGHGAPTLRGTALPLAKDGVYTVTDPADIEAMHALGYLDADAPVAKSAPAQASPTLRAAVQAVLKDLGTVVPDGAGDDVLVKALGDLPAAVATAAEEAVAKALAGKNDDKKKQQ